MVKGYGEDTVNSRGGVGAARHKKLSDFVKMTATDNNHSRSISVSVASYVCVSPGPAVLYGVRVKTYTVPLSRFPTVALVG